MVSAFDYSRMQSTAERLISRFGSRTATLLKTRTNGTKFDPVVTRDPIACTAVEMAYSQREIDGERIKATDVRVYVAAKDLAEAPTTDDKFVWKGVERSIVPPVNELNPAGTPVYYELQLRS